MPSAKKSSSAQSSVPLRVASRSAARAIPPKAGGVRSVNASSLKAHSADASWVQVKAGALVNVLIEVNPLLDIVRQHVRDLSPSEVRAVKRGFMRVLRGDSSAVSPLARNDRIPRGRLVDAVDAADPVLSTQEAADLVGVSRPYMVARIDAGDIPLHQKVGQQRRVLKSSVLAWQKREQSRQRRALGQLGDALDDEIFSS